MYLLYLFTPTLFQFFLESLERPPPPGQGLVHGCQNPPEAKLIISNCVFRFRLYSLPVVHGQEVEHLIRLGLLQVQVSHHTLELSNSGQCKKINLTEC